MPDYPSSEAADGIWSLREVRRSILAGQGAFQGPVNIVVNDPTTVSNFINSTEDMQTIAGSQEAVDAIFGNTEATESVALGNRLNLFYDANIPDFGPFEVACETPDGGEQQTVLLGAEQRLWILVGRIQDSAKDEVRNPMDSSRGVVDLSQNGQSKWSADWGSETAQDIMVWGATDFPGRSGHTVNWVYQVKSDTTYRAAMSNANGDGAGDTTIDNIQPLPSVENNEDGHIFNGARDGVFTGSRWTNQSYTDHRISDPDGAFVNPFGFSSPRSPVFDLEREKNDGKFSVSAVSSSSGQDTGRQSQLFGSDDDRVGFFDVGTGEEGQNSTRVDFNSAVTFWLHPA